MDQWESIDENITNYHYTLNSMKIFVTGGTGYIGTSVVKQLISDGHTVAALARTEEKAQYAKYIGAEPVSGTITDLGIIKAETDRADAVVHLAFATDFQDPVAALKDEAAAIDVICGSMEGTNKAFIFTSGALVLAQAPGSTLANEDFSNFIIPPPFSGRVDNERAVIAYKDKGVKSMIIRCTAVHDTSRTSYNEMWLAPSKMMGFVPCFNGGESQMSAVNRSDVAKLYSLALSKGTAGSIYHASAETNTMRKVADGIATHLGLKVVDLSGADIPPEMSMVASLLSMNTPTSSEKTKAELGWNPTGSTLIESISAQTI